MIFTKLPQFFGRSESPEPKKARAESCQSGDQKAKAEKIESENVEEHSADQKAEAEKTKDEKVEDQSADQKAEAEKTIDEKVKDQKMAAEKVEHKAVTGATPGCAEDTNGSQGSLVSTCLIVCGSRSG